jgi:hypothetical protein
LPIFGSSGFTRRSTRSDSSPISSTDRTLTSSRTSASSASRSRRSPPGKAIHIVASGWRIRIPAVPRSVRASSTALRAVSIAASRGSSRSAASSSAGQRVRWTESGAAPSIVVTRLRYIDSEMNGSSGARTRATVTSASWSVANAAARSASSAFREKRFLESRTYQVERSSMNVEIRRLAPRVS